MSGMVDGWGKNCLNDVPKSWRKWEASDFLYERKPTRLSVCTRMSISLNAASQRNDGAERRR